jgi:lysylphosphatidylglycerol synthetase-like protein (DUF2156 family)
VALVVLVYRHVIAKNDHWFRGTGWLLGTTNSAPVTPDAPVWLHEKSNVPFAGFI